jgi:RhtB (resistance to homoserine/threonine) family protein
MDGHWLEFAQVAGAHLLAVASPGPDFAIVLKQSLVHGRRTALLTGLGIGTAILLHVTYSLLGLGLVIGGSELWFAIVKFAGAAYLAWIGIQSLRTKPRTGGGAAAAVVGQLEPTSRAAFAKGFLTNALNPKATLFFISLFAVVVNPRTPKIVQAGYGAWMALATAAWFCLVALLFTEAPVRRTFFRFGHWIDRALGVVFLAFAASLLIAQIR